MICSTICFKDKLQNLTDMQYIHNWQQTLLYHAWQYYDKPTIGERMVMEGLENLFIVPEQKKNL